MADSIVLNGTIRTNTRPNIPAGSYLSPNMNNGLDMIVAQGLPPLTELVRLGVVWDVAIATGSAFTYVAAWPTTRGELVVYNGEPAGGKSLVWLSAWLYNITSMGAAQPMTLIGQNVPVVATVPTDDTAQLVSSRSGKVGYSGRMRRAVANTAAGQTTNLWRVLCSGLISSPTTNLGASVWADMRGAVITPPGGVMAFNAVAGTAAGTAIIGATFAELQIDLG